MPNCEKYKDWLDDYLDGLLPEEKAEEMKQHLATCAECRLRLEHLQLIASALRELPVPPTPAELRHRVQEKLTRQPKPSFISLWHKFFTFRRLRVIGEIAALFLVLYIGWEFFYSSKSKPTLVSEVTHKPEKLQQTHLQIGEKSVSEIEDSAFGTGERRLAGEPPAVITAAPTPATCAPATAAMKEAKDLAEPTATARLKEELRFTEALNVKSESAHKPRSETIIHLKIKSQPAVSPPSRPRVMHQTTVDKELPPPNISQNIRAKAPVKSDELILEEKPMPYTAERITTSVLNTIIADLGGKIVPQAPDTLPTNSLHFELPANNLPAFLQRLDSLNYSYELLSTPVSSPEQTIQMEISW